MFLLYQFFATIHCRKYAHGNLLSANGNLLSDHGNLLSADGNLLSDNGNLRSGNGNLLPADGNLLSGAFRRGKLETCFQLLSGLGNWKLSAERPHSISLHSHSILVKSKSSHRMDFNFKYTSTSLISNKLRYPPRKRRRRRASFLKFLSRRSTKALPCSSFFTSATTFDGAPYRKNACVFESRFLIHALCAFRGP